MRFELDEIVVTAARAADPLRDVPRNVAVITAEDIAQAPGASVMELLSREAGLHVRQTTGSPDRAVLDIRGMGDTAGSGVVVMIDGLKVNSPDMAGQNLGSVPVEAIQRIEVVRGAGSVVYGNGAVGGVVNIITKEERKEPGGSVSGAYGSYSAYDLSAAYGGRHKDLRFDFRAGRRDSEGYRNNGFYRASDVSLDAGYQLSEKIDFTLSGAYHEDAYGLPGPVPLSDADDTSLRKETDRPEDAGETEEARARAGVSLDLGKWGELSLKRGYRFRDNEFVIGYTPLLPRDVQTDDIDEETRQLDLDYRKRFSFMGRTHRFQLGADYYQTHYVREEMPDGPRKNSATEILGVFVHNRWSLPRSLAFSWGARTSRYEGRFRTDRRRYFPSVDARFWVNGEAEDREFDNNAVHAGLTWQGLPDTTLYADFATSFRIPNVDEFAEAEEGLSPQEGRHVELGVKRRLGTAAELGVSLYGIRIEDEIYYSEVNRNYDDTTLRRGVEADIKVYPTDALYLWAAYTYMEAEFEESGDTVPLVPRHKAAAGFDWELCPPFTLSVSGAYTGSQYDGNDIENNRYEKLDAYWVFDTAVRYTREELELFASVENIFNELYSTSAYSESRYPMPERNFKGGIRWRF
jgi:TonB-dependent siderophore receptor